MTKRVLAAELGTASETFSRALAKFRRQKLISNDGNFVTLHCPTRLARFVSQNRRNGSGPRPPVRQAGRG